MSRTASAYGLTSPRKADWRDAAACRDQDPDLFFPKGDSGPWLMVIEEAKAVCRRCPVLDACGQWALDNREEFGIFGALTEQERAALRRSTIRHRLTPAEVAAKAEAAQQPKKPRTLRTLHDDNTKPLHGHLVWTGPDKLSFKGQSFTPKQLAFTLDRGHTPDGGVRAECGIPACVLAAHLADYAERTRCGTRPGYRLHLERGETPCDPCRRANADADNRLRWTGSTQVAV